MAVPAVIVVQALKESINAATQYAMCREHEKTERERIAARLEAQLTIINKSYDAYALELSKHHEEAMSLYKQLTDLIKQSDVIGNLELTKTILQTLQIVHAKNCDSRPSFR